MKITLENIGIFKFAEYELNDLTIVCGHNNTGKTYATYALYGFLDYFRNGYTLKIKKQDVEKLQSTGSLAIPLDITQAKIDKYLSDACSSYIKFLPKIFSANAKYFNDAKFKVQIDVSEIKLKENFEESYKSSSSDIIQIVRDGDFLQCNLVVKDADDNLSRVVSRLIGNALKSVLFDNILPDSFIASAERTGSVIFKDELDFQKNALLKVAASEEDVDLDNIADKIYNISYALPIRRNIDFIRKLDSITKLDGELYKEAPHIIEYFNTLVKGIYKVSRGNVTYSPSNNSSKKLSIGESASAVRSLLMIYFYLRHVAKPGDMLMIDEPELNLHPESQRKFAKLITKLINAGIKVFITTHSDYILKEINSLIMFNARSSEMGICKIMDEYDYVDSDLIHHEKVSVYISKKHQVLLKGKARKSNIQTLVKACVDPSFGIEADSFDETINLMNHIQESIIFSSDE